MGLNQRYFLLKQSRETDEYISKKELSMKFSWDYDAPLLCLEPSGAKARDRIFVPFIERRPDFVVSTAFKEIVLHFTDRFVFRPCHIGIQGQLPQERYYFMKSWKLHCHSSKTVFDKSSQAVKLVLNRELIGPYSIFELGGIPGHKLIVNMEILEELLAEKVLPMDYEEIECTVDLGCRIPL